jgi:hypothetical protein
MLRRRRTPGHHRRTTSRHDHRGREPHPERLHCLPSSRSPDRTPRRRRTTPPHTRPATCLERLRRSVQSGRHSARGQGTDGIRRPPSPSVTAMGRGDRPLRMRSALTRPLRFGWQGCDCHPRSLRPSWCLCRSGPVRCDRCWCLTSAYQRREHPPRSIPLTRQTRARRSSRCDVADLIHASSCRWSASSPFDAVVGSTGRRCPPRLLGTNTSHSARPAADKPPVIRHHPRKR